MDKKSSKIKLLSVVTVCYNAQQNIELTLKSVIDGIKEFKDEIEYLVIDGGSNDNTMPIVNKYSKDINVIVSERDNGIYDAMNKGLALSTGIFCYFINSGDELLSMPLEIISKNRSVDMISFPVKQSNNEVFYPTANIALRYRNTLHHQGNFYNIQTTEQYSLNFKVFSDFDLNQKIMKKKGSIITMRSPIVATHDIGGISHDKKYLNEIFAVVRGNYGGLYSLISRAYFKKLGILNKLNSLLKKN